MSRPPKSIVVTESLSELKQLHKKTAAHLQPRIQMLILSQQGKAAGKQGLANALGVNPNSVQIWRTKYNQGGLPALLQYERGGHLQPLIDPKTDAAIVAKLSNPLEAPRSYKELQQWVDEHYISGINYHTLNKHVKRKHQVKLKVARKVHVKKEEGAADTFKKR